MKNSQSTYQLGNANFVLPTGWTEVMITSERLVFDASDVRQRLTISLLQFDGNVTFEGFSQLCEKRIEFERRELTNGFIQPEKPSPFQDNGVFGMFFSGADKNTGRIFSCYLSLMNNDLVSVYIEGFDVTPTEHLESFKSVVASLKRG